MKYWLVEEQKAVSYDMLSWKVTWHAVVSAKSAVNAFIIAENRFAKRDSYAEGRYRTTKDIIDSGDWAFAFGPDELKEAAGSEGYLWNAADGSFVTYEVRYLGELDYDRDRETAEFV
jgi:hypothetical protein